MIGVAHRATATVIAVCNFCSLGRIVNGNANGDSCDHDRKRIVAKPDNERSAAGKEVRLHQGLVEAARATARLGENPQFTRRAWRDQS